MYCQAEHDYKNGYTRRVSDNVEDYEYDIET